MEQLLWAGALKTDFIDSNLDFIINSLDIIYSLHTLDSLWNGTVIVIITYIKWISMGKVLRILPRLILGTLLLLLLLLLLLIQLILMPSLCWHSQVGSKEGALIGSCKISGWEAG